MSTWPHLSVAFWNYFLKLSHTFSPLVLPSVQVSWCPVHSPPASCICCPGYPCQSFQSLRGHHNNPGSHPVNDKHVLNVLIYYNQRRFESFEASKGLLYFTNTCIWKNSPISSKIVLALLCSASFSIPACNQWKKYYTNNSLDFVWKNNTKDKHCMQTPPCTWLQPQGDKRSRMRSCISQWLCTWSK